MAARPKKVMTRAYRINLNDIVTISYQILDFSLSEREAYAVAQVSDR